MRKFSFAIIWLTVGLLTLYGLPWTAQAIPQSTESCVRYRGNPVLTAGGPSQWDSLGSAAGGVGRTSIIFNNATYLMWYSTFGKTASIGFASSADGVRWTKANRPVLTPGANGSWDDFAVYAPSVVLNGSRYLMYFTGENSSRVFSVGLALSSDGLHWNKYSKNPVLTAGPANYDSLYVRYPGVVYEDGTYKMWYTGHARLDPSNTLSTINYATSIDGIHWIKYPGNPIIPANNPSFVGIVTARTSAVGRLDSVYLMATDFANGGISYAISNDGIRWNASGFLLSDSPSGSAWDAQTFSPSIIINGSRILLWYTGDNGTNSGVESIGLAICPMVLVSTTATSTETSISTITTTLIQTSTETLVSTRTTQTEIPIPSVAAISAASIFAILAVMALAYSRRARSAAG